jgi:hypothetical protein
MGTWKELLSQAIERSKVDMKTYSRRLRRLERQFASEQQEQQRSQKLSGFSAVEWVTAQLDKKGIVREPKESLMEALARSVGWTPMQLKEYLQMRAAGLK